MKRTLIGCWAGLCLLLMLQVAQAETATYQVAASADDTFCASSYTAYGNTTLYWPYNISTVRGFVCWAIDIPPGATITSATVQVKAQSTRANTTTSQLQLVDSDSCPDFSTNPFSWAVIGPTADWDVPPFTADTWYTSPDITAIVQGYVDREGYESGNYLGLRSVWVNGGTAKMIHPWDSGDHTDGAKLVVTYSTTYQAPVADAGSDQEVTDQDGSGFETVSLDGSASSDPDGTITSYVWKKGDTQIATGSTADVSLSVGTHIITLTVTDDDAVTDDDTVVVIVNSPPEEETVQYQIAASADDTFCANSYTAYGNATLYWPYNTDTVRGFACWAIDIPPGATITSATVQVKAKTTRPNTTTSQFQLVDSDDCPDFSTNPFSWAVTGPTVDWGVPPLTADTWYTSPDITAIVQGYVDREGYESGNYLGLRSVWVSGGTTKMIHPWDSGDHTDGAKLVVTYSAGQGTVADYYVDFDGGSDSNDGTSTGSPWQHCPGDPNATGNAATCALNAGEVIVFKGGVKYRGSINCNWSGSAGAPITYDGNPAGTFGTGQAIIDGSETLPGWTQCQSAAEAGGNPNWANIWYAYAPAGTDANTSNLYQDDGDEQMCWMAQDPNQSDPFFMDNRFQFYAIPCENVTLTTVTDSVRLTQGDSSYWDGAGVMVWAQPNAIKARDITGFDPATDTITFDSIISQPYTDRDERYALYNHISLLDQAGEYYFNDTAEGDGTHKVYLWPPAGNPNTNPVSISVPAARTKAFSIVGANRSYLTFDGLKMQKFSGAGYYDACGIVSVESGISNITITDCTFMYLRHDYRGGNGYGAIVLKYGSDCTISGNTFYELPVTNGMQVSISDSIIEDNFIERPGRHGMWMVFNDCQIIGNVVLDVGGSHANAIAVFPGSSNVLVMGNTIFAGPAFGISISDADDVTVAYNFVCSSSESYSDQGGCTNLKAHNNTILNDVDTTSYRDNSSGELKNNIINIVPPNTSTLQLQLVDSDSCPAFSTNPWSSAVTGPTVDWAVPAVTQDTWYTSPDITEIVQAYVDREDYDPGDYIGLRASWLDGGAKMMYQWDYDDHTSGPKLVVTYSPSQDVTYQIAASADDTFCGSSYTSYGNAAIYWPYNSSTVRGFVRWACNIPAGATITSATVQVKAKVTASGSNLQHPSLTPDANGNLFISHAMESEVFTDPANGDFSLKVGGPAIDAGLDLGYDYDIDGTAVPQGDDPDIGAIEYTP
jgi:K319L-like, PKD domain/Right handed beta helix region